MSIVVVYRAGDDFGKLLDALEGEFLTRLEIGTHKRVGAARACIIDVVVPNDFVLHAAQRRLEALPAAGIKAVERFPESRWTRPRWHIGIGISIGIGVGIALMFIGELLRPLTARMREALG